jgi:hypothetical protein
LIAEGLTTPVHGFRSVSSDSRIKASSFDVTECGLDVSRGTRIPRVTY